MRVILIILNLHRTINISLYREVNEFLTNIRKHAGTRKAQIQLSATDSHIMVQVQNPGTGRDVEKFKPCRTAALGSTACRNRYSTLAET